VTAAPSRPVREPQRIAAMFDRIVPRYDLMNHLMTVGLDRRWRELAAAAVDPLSGEPLLDACCGTGDLTLALRRRHPASPVTGLDASAAMLDRARAKVAGQPGIEFVTGDLLALPFAKGHFAAVTVGWGVRNVADVRGAFVEMVRVTRAGGRVVCLEATRPPGSLGRRFHAVWFERLVPLLGAVVAGDREAYSYLPASVRSFPDADGLATLMREAGLVRIRFRRLGLDAMALHVGTVPP